MKLSGIVKIDTQHSMLFSAMKDARMLVEADQFDALLTLLGKLEAYIGFHFRDEEQFMRDNNVSGYDEHVICHRRFRDSVQQHIAELEKTGEPSFEILTFAEDWLINHINVEAVLFQQYVKH